MSSVNPPQTWKQIFSTKSHFSNSMILMIGYEGFCLTSVLLIVSFVLVSSFLFIKSFPGYLWHLFCSLLSLNLFQSVVGCFFFHSLFIASFLFSSFCIFSFNARQTPSRFVVLKTSRDIMTKSGFFCSILTSQNDLIFLLIFVDISLFV